MGRLIVTLLSIIFCSAVNAQEARQSLDFKIPVLSSISRHIELLKVPSYALLAMENKGLRLSLSTHVVLKSRNAFQMNIGTLRYVGSRGGVLLYESELMTSFIGTGSRFTVPVEVDTSRIIDGTISVRAFPPLASRIPQEIIDKVEFKIRSLANLQTQAELIAYLDELRASPAVKNGGFEAMLEAIMLESYNRIAVEAKGEGGFANDCGVTESVSIQKVLLITLMIWGIGFPVFLYIIRMRRRWA